MKFIDPKDNLDWFEVLCCSFITLLIVGGAVWIAFHSGN